MCSSAGRSSSTSHSPPTACLPYDSPVVKEAKIDPVFVSPDNYWHGWFMGTLVILLNPERFDKEIAPKGIGKAEDLGRSARSRL